MVNYKISFNGLLPVRDGGWISRKVLRLGRLLAVEACLSNGIGRQAKAGSLGKSKVETQHFGKFDRFSNTRSIKCV